MITLLKHSALGIAGGLVAMLLVGLILYGPKWIMDHWANLKVQAQTSDIQAASNLSAQDELNKYLQDHDQNQQKKERSIDALHRAAAPKPTDDPNGKAEARRRYDAWVAGIVSLCPDCKADGVEDKPGDRTEDVPGTAPATFSEHHSYGWRDGSVYEDLFVKAGFRPA